MILHLDIQTSTVFTVKNDVKVFGNIVNTAYFTRNIIRINHSMDGKFLTVMLPNNISYILTHNQNNECDEIYVVDTVDGVAPTDLYDLAAKLNALIRF